MLTQPLLGLVGAAVLGASSVASPSSQSTSVPLCAEWRECRRLAIEAVDRGAYEQFHDLAWRTLQTGPPHNPDLMLLLARAQALSGRPHDALVMIERLADMGVAVDVASDDFVRTRQLADWPAAAARIAAARSVAAPTPRPAPSAASSAAPPTTSSSAASRTPAAPVVPAPTAPAIAVAPAPRPSALTLRPAPRSDAARFVAVPFSPGGLAYDGVSQRFVVGDATELKLLVVGVNGGTATDMVRADSAGFEDVVALEIDAPRGDLWVAGANGAVHRLQLVSGRPLRTYRPTGIVDTVRLADIGLTPSGSVVGLDAAGRRLLTLSRGGDAVRPTMQVSVENPSSVVLDDEGVAFVAHEGGIVRADLRSHVTAAVSAPTGVDLRGIVRLRAHRRALVALQSSEAGPYRIVRLGLDGRRRQVTAATVIDPQGPPPIGRPFLTVSGDDLYYVTEETAGDSDGAGSTRQASYVVRRLRLP